MLMLHFKVFYDNGGAVGRRYQLQDKTGMPFGITVDSQTLEDETVTSRDRDSIEQAGHGSVDLITMTGK